MSRQYGIMPGSVDRSGRISPPKSDQRPPPQLDNYSQEAYPLRQVSPTRSYHQPPRTPPEADGIYAAAAAGPYAVPQAYSSQQTYRDVDDLYNPRMTSPSPGPDHGPYEQSSMGSFNPPSRPDAAYQQTYSQSSLAPLAAGQGMGYSSPPNSRGGPPAMAAGAGMGAGLAAGDFESRMPRSSYYHGDGYDDNFDPNDIADDGDDGFNEAPRSGNGHPGASAAAAAGAGAGAGAAGGALKAFGTREPSGGNYGPVGGDPEKSAWLSKQSSGNKKLKWTVGIVILLLVLGAIAGGVAGGLLANKGSGGGSSSGPGGNTSGSNKGTHSGGDYDIDSNEVQAVMNNNNLHKVFPAMDYTPNYAQYPQCLSKGGGPVQNNVTIDVAIMSQLTPSIRLYGTDCNQTELVIEAIDRLKMKDTMKVWLGVYLDGNTTTNDRQIAHMYDVLDKYDHSYFSGVIVGNEVLFGKYLTATQLQNTLGNIKTNFTSKGINLPLSTADLGDNWDAALAAESDIVMANIHPFFAGTVAADSAGWAYSFWTGKDVPLKTAKTATNGDITYPTQIISEIGWPSQGGNDCGDATDPAYGCTSDTQGAVASIDNMNTFMDGWVCGALNNGTTFFWFEAFDEPWKHQFDTAHNKWEPYWGLFDVDRNLKDGLKIPDCGGKTVDKVY